MHITLFIRRQEENKKAKNTYLCLRALRKEGYISDSKGDALAAAHSLPGDVMLLPQVTGWILLLQAAYRCGCCAWGHSRY
jgi:hypothetical protein